MRQLLSYVRRAVDDYRMILPGDTIAVGLSGGKDSLSLLAALTGLRRFYPNRFELIALTLDMGFEGSDFSGLAEYCKSIDVPFYCKETKLKEIIFDIRNEKNPCSLCAKMRRGALHEFALSHGVHKVALGHHYDDAVETVLLSLFYEGRFHCFQPLTYLDRKDITLIRPLLYAPESYIRKFARRATLPVVNNPCPADGNTRREDMKTLLRDLEKMNPGVKERIFGAIGRYPFKGWEPFNK